MNASAHVEQRTQADRSASMRARLIEATIAALVDYGYARTTAVEICRRAGVTRGALHHHFADLSELYMAAASDICDRYFAYDDGDGRFETLVAWLDAAWAHISRSEFKCIIELCLAVRNDPDLATRLRPVIDPYMKRFLIAENTEIQRRVGASQEAQAFYSLAGEAMIGLGFRRATTPVGAAYEAAVLDQLRALARKVAR